MIDALFSARDAKCTAHAPTGRRRAAWLLVGWLAFWLTTAAQPFEHAFAAGRDHHSTASTPGSGGHLPSMDHSNEPAPADSHCPDVSAVTVDTMFAAIVKGNSFDADYPSSNSLVPVTQRDGEMPNLKSYFPPPPSPIPLYLRTRRLLI